MNKKIIPVLILFLATLSACSGRRSVEYQAVNEIVSESSLLETEGEEETAADETADQVSEAEAGLQQMEEVSLFVDISGEVLHPGVYELPVGNRIFHAVSAAGGFTDQAEIRCINQADLLYDGEKIYVYSIAEAERLGGWMQLNGIESPSQSANLTQRADETSGGSGKVNINQADKTELMSLTGVGEARADAIISYRETNGAFSTIEDIMNVSGIKEKLFEQIKDKITV